VKVPVSQNAHTTRQECIFLDNLGRYAVTRYARLGLLRAYREAIPLRHRWSGIDHLEVAAHCDRLIIEALRQQAMAE
jgi:hypothetical protein